MILNKNICEPTSYVKCPYCNSEAIYSYGKAHTGKKRFLCLQCNKQFTIGIKKLTINEKPVCPICGSSMHIYKREKHFLRFRCANYPSCRTFVKVKINHPENS